MSAVKGSSCVVASPSSPPLFNSVLNHTSMASSRHLSDCFQSAGDWSAVIVISCPPMAFISSRMMFSMFLRTRSPSGKYEYATDKELGVLRDFVFGSEFAGFREEL